VQRLVETESIISTGPGESRVDSPRAERMRFAPTVTVTMVTVMVMLLNPLLPLEGLPMVPAVVTSGFVIRLNRFIRDGEDLDRPTLHEGDDLTLRIMHHFLDILFPYVNRRVIVLTRDSRVGHAVVRRSEAEARENSREGRRRRSLGFVAWSLVISEGVEVDLLRGKVLEGIEVVD